MDLYRVTTDELYHHGIKGQKWYVRRYQNEDGTLTEEGKRRLKRFGVGAAFGVIGVIGSTAIAKAMGKKISSPIVAKYFYDATPENAKIIANGIEAIGVIPMAIIGETVGYKVGHAIFDKYFDGTKPKEK